MSKGTIMRLIESMKYAKVEELWEKSQNSIYQSSFPHSYIFNRFYQCLKHWWFWFSFFFFASLFIYLFIYLFSSSFYYLFILFYFILFYLFLFYFLLMLDAWFFEGTIFYNLSKIYLLFKKIILKTSNMNDFDFQKW